MSTLGIPYEADGFPADTLPSGRVELQVTWGDILWAAVTIGRPNLYYVFRHGASSRYEALFRWSLIRMALEQSDPNGRRLRRTSAMKTLDPTEKGAVNYFLGMTFCKLFATKLLNTPWLLHLDVFRPYLNPALIGRSRPDLIGREHGTARWHAFECKGRSSPPDSAVKDKAKVQAQRLVSVNGTACTLHIGAITHFRNDVLHFYWRDPSPRDDKEIRIFFKQDFWRQYYSPIMQMILGADPKYDLHTIASTPIPVEGLDLDVSIHPSVARFLLKKNWDAAQSAAVEAASEIAKAGYQLDGLLVKSGPSWLERFDNSSINEGKHGNTQG